MHAGYRKHEGACSSWALDHAQQAGVRTTRHGPVCMRQGTAHAGEAAACVYRAKQVHPCASVYSGLPMLREQRHACIIASYACMGGS